MRADGQYRDGVRPIKRQNYWQFGVDPITP